MFTGIIETVGEVISIVSKEGSVDFQIKSSFTNELRPEESVSHNGVCLTVTSKISENYFVTAIPETLSKTNLGLLKTGDKVNLERSMPVNGRFDGHIVQGHVDQTAYCINKVKTGDSWILEFKYDPELGNYTVSKGSICVNGISLTVVKSENDIFSVAVIPYTLEHTNLGFIEVGDIVNIEFDIIGKYLNQLFFKYRNNQ